MAASAFPGPRAGLLLFLWLTQFGDQLLFPLAPSQQYSVTITTPPMNVNGTMNPVETEALRPAEPLTTSIPTFLCPTWKVKSPPPYPEDLAGDEA